MKAEEIIARDIPGFEGRYSITRYGRVWSHGGMVKNGRGYRRFKARWLKNKSQAGEGYWQIHLGAGNQYYIHHLVMAAWGPAKPSGHYEINHIDGNRLNNHVSNLEWVTPQQNSRHARRTGLTRQDGENSVNAKLTELQVLDIRARYTGERGNVIALAREFGVGHPTIIKIIKRERWKHI